MPERRTSVFALRWADTQVCPYDNTYMYLTAAKGQPEQRLNFAHVACQFNLKSELCKDLFGLSHRQCLVSRQLHVVCILGVLLRFGNQIFFAFGTHYRATRTLNNSVHRKASSMTAFCLRQFSTISRRTAGLLAIAS